MSREELSKAATVDSPEAVACVHCGLPVPAAMRHPENKRHFCCHGCEVAYAILGEDEELRREWQRRASQEPVASDYAEWLHPEFQSRYVTRFTPEHHCVEWTLAGLYGAGCVLAIEKLPRFLPGVQESRVNLTTARIRVSWNPQQVELPEIARTLDRLGYKPHALDEDENAATERAESRRRLVHIAIAGACAGNAMLVAFAMYYGFFSGIADEHLQLFRWTSAGLAAVSLFWPGAVFFRNAWRAMCTRTPHMDIPVAVGLSAGGAMGLVNTILGRGEIYFDSITVLVFLLLVGRYVQYCQQRKAIRQVSLLNALTPRWARRYPSNSAGEITAERTAEVIPLSAVRVGDWLEVRAGDLIPVDGRILRGATTLDQSILTGEAVAIPAGPDTPVAAGTTNVTAPVVMIAESTAGQSRVAEIARLIESSMQSKTPTVQFANAIGGYFVAVVLLLAGITLLAWWSTSVETALNHAMALLIVACPCALGLATPFTVAIAQARAARRQILIKSGDALELLARPGELWLDKTGTLTEGRLRLLDWQGADDVKAGVMALERQVVHPVAVALTRDLQVSPAEEVEPPRDVLALPGLGLQGTWRGGCLLVGSDRLLSERALNIREDFQAALENYVSRGWTPLVVALEGDVQAVCAVGDRLREEAADVSRKLADAGWQLGMLSGDHPDVVRCVAADVGIPAERALGRVSPEEKLVRVQQAGSSGTVVMVGDGVNDSAALAAASVGIAVHGGAAVSLQAADVYINRPGLEPLHQLMIASRQTVRTIYRNFAVSLGYNSLAALLAMTGVINPIIAAVLMPLSSLSVLIIASLNPAFRGRS